MKYLWEFWAGYQFCKILNLHHVWKQFHVLDELFGGSPFELFQHANRVPKMIINSLPATTRWRSRNLSESKRTVLTSLVISVIVYFRDRAFLFNWTVHFGPNLRWLTFWSWSLFDSWSSSSAMVLSRWPSASFNPSLNKWRSSSRSFFTLCLYWSVSKCDRWLKY